jgi:hypothetical protein
MAGFVAAQEATVPESTQSPEPAARGKFKVSDMSLGGYGFWEFGQIVKGTAEGQPLDHQWTSRALLGVRFEIRPSDFLYLDLNPEFRFFYPLPELNTGMNRVRMAAVAYINEMKGVFSAGDKENPFLTATLGMFDYKYNPESRDLGEYLFRTGTYPLFVVNDFDFPEARLLGLKLTTDAVPNLHADVLLTSEYMYYPLYDFSLSAIASYTLLKAVTVGGGVEFARCLPVNDSKTSIGPTTDLGGNQNSAQFVTESGDTIYPSFKATKLMGRLTIDPKKFFPGVALFGPEDLKIYGEVGILGFGYKTKAPDSVYLMPAFYSDINRRIPIMFGLNIPAFKLLDVLSAEAEYFPIGYPNDYFAEETQRIPVPRVDIPTYSPGKYRDLEWRWAFYFKKEVTKGFSISGQVAYDHLRTTFTDGWPSTAESLIQKGDWFWIVKTGYDF